MLIIGLSLFPNSQLQSQMHCIFSSAKWTIFKTNDVFKAIDVDTRREVVIKHEKQVLIIGLSLFPKSQLYSIFLSANTVQLALGK